MPKDKIFISYAREDETFARALAGLLSKEGLSVWIDVQDIPAGEHWSNAIQQGLDAAEVMLLIVSPESMVSKNVQDEWMYFRDKDKAIIPVILRQAALHYRLSSLQWVDFSREDETLLFKYARLREALRALDTALSSVPSPPFTIKDPAGLRANPAPTPPAFVEEARRLDAAMPRQVSIHQPTEVWAQICLPQSQGFRDKLPHFTEQGDVINQGDVKESRIIALFPVDPATGQPRPLRVTVELRGPEYQIDVPRQEALLLAGKDSGLLTFIVTPTAARARVLLQVIVRAAGPDGAEITLGAAALATEVLAEGVQRGMPAPWVIASSALGTRAASASSGGEKLGGVIELEEAAPSDDRFDLPDMIVPEFERSLPPEPQASKPTPPAAVLAPPPSPIAPPAPITPAPAAPASTSASAKELAYQPQRRESSPPGSMAPTSTPARHKSSQRTRPVVLVAVMVGLILVLLLMLSISMVSAPNTEPTRPAETVTQAPVVSPTGP